MSQQFFKLPSSEIGSNHEGFLTSAPVKAHAIAGEDYCILASDTRQNKAAISLNGYAADGIAMVKKLKQKMEWYEHAHDKEMSTPALAQMIAITLYVKRFFPYYISNTLAGLDENGKGVIYRFDPVGSFEPVPLPLPLDKAITIAKDAFTSAVERYIYTGDYLEIFVITKDGVEIQSYDLKKD
ncbi:10424_t:CDS:2 [Entrophospora sp. SA101]|nr:9656_t:CDS:2 [Entrophospora sp. SA101]CAJ0635213.1 9739_t:CDS:2 [Entrophospora sp. SA101]CAJ0768754.1 10424_t:CDS:2 [Entrophospora sp. SA101]CAJ0834022.1 20161_t:CDS:2 [Entrophospora sp. SA101]CAJ0910506.1 17147_t:CDS:2 [Entrophospora sp. SA101]